MIQPALDLRVTLERICVRTRACHDARPRPAFLAGYLDARRGAPPHDHRITIRALCIDVEAELDALAARNLGRELAAALVAELAALQQRRHARLREAPATGGPIYVETLRVQLHGEPAQHPPHQQITAALIDELTARASHG